MAASANIFYESRPRPVTRTGSHPVTDAAKIWFNAMVGLDATSGLAKPYDGAAATIWLGFASEERTGNSALLAGDPEGRVVVDESGPTLKVDVVGVTGSGDNGDPVWGTDDNTFTKTDPGGGETPIGYIRQRISGTTCWVDFLSAQEWFAKK